MALAALDACINAVGLLAAKPAEECAAYAVLLETGSYPAHELVYIITLGDNGYHVGECAQVIILGALYTGQYVTVDYADVLGLVQTAIYDR